MYPMKSSRVLMHIDLRWMDMMARTHRKNFSTCLKDSPFFLGTKAAQALRCFTNTMATSGNHLLSNTVLASSH